MSQDPFNMQEYLASISEKASKEAHKNRLKVLKKTWNEFKNYSDGTMLCKAVDDGKQCNKEFKTQQGLYNHQIIHLWIAKDMDPKYQCHYCAQKFWYIRDLKSHITKQHYKQHCASCAGLADDPIEDFSD